jgi:electron transfer flavoprotein alpha subunit
MTTCFQRIKHNINAFQGLPENFAPLVLANVEKNGFTHILAGHSAFGKNLMPRVAALLNSQQISDIIDIQSEDSKKKSFI